VGAEMRRLVGVVFIKFLLSRDSVGVFPKIKLKIIIWQNLPSEVTIILSSRIELGSTPAMVILR
jgi:hypothetical protein